MTYCIGGMHLSIRYTTVIVWCLQDLHVPVYYKTAFGVLESTPPLLKFKNIFPVCPFCLNILSMHPCLSNLIARDV